jgi:hypothetical protein
MVATVLEERRELVGARDRTAMPYGTRRIRQRAPAGLPDNRPKSLSFWASPPILLS